MVKKLKRNICAATLVFASMPAFSQLTISGPACAVRGAKYQYSISNATAWDSSATMQVCVTGGIIADQNQNTAGGCSETGPPLSSVLVIWNDTAATASLTVNSSAGTKKLDINITTELDPGAVDSLSIRQEITDTVSIPAVIVCSAVKGGSCSPAYSYQWQQSNDMLLWKDITGAVEQNLSFNSRISQTYYYRRRVTDMGSGTIGYSDIATIIVSGN